MSWIKDVIDTSRDLAKDKQALNKIKSGLRNQAKLKQKFLKELLKKHHLILPFFQGEMPKGQRGFTSKQPTSPKIMTTKILT